MILYSKRGCMKLSAFIILLTHFIFFNISYAVCEPEINVSNTQIFVKEGHKDQQNLVDFMVEMDRFCPSEIVTLKIIVKEITARFGENFSIPEVNYINIQPGSVKDGFSIAILGDNEWNENRVFEVAVISTTHGWLNSSGSTIEITNDDPRIKLVMQDKVIEPKKGVLNIPLKVELEFPAEQIIKGEIEIKGISATKDEDYSSNYSIGFEILPGESYFEFLPKTLVINSDSEKEQNESLYLEFMTIKGATPLYARKILTISEVQASYKLKITSNISNIAEGKVAIISNYSHETELVLNEETKNYEFKNEEPIYTHKILNSPFQVKTKPGLLSGSFSTGKSENINNEESLTLEFIKAPSEVYPYNPYPLYLFISSFLKLHEDEFITVSSPGLGEYPAFKINHLTKNGDNLWNKTYIRNFKEDGEIIFKEKTIIEIKELE